MLTHAPGYATPRGFCTERLLRHSTGGLSCPFSAGRHLCCRTPTCKSSSERICRTAPLKGLACGWYLTCQILLSLSYSAATPPEGHVLG